MPSILTTLTARAVTREEEMKNSFKFAVVAVACAAAALAFGTIGFRQQPPAQKTVHVYTSNEAMAKFHKLGIQLSGFQMMLVTLVSHEYMGMAKGVTDEAAGKRLTSSQEMLGLRLLTAEQQKAALAEMIKRYPEAKDLKLGSPLVNALGQVNDDQKAKFLELHEKIQAHMKGLSEEELAAFHRGEATGEMQKQIHTSFLEVYGMMTPDQRKEWDNVLATLAAEKKRLQSR